jgi:hypothetical protein
MRKFWLLGILASSLALSACGSSATITSAVNSIGASPDLQVHVTMSAAGSGSQQVEAVLGLMSVDMNYSSNVGGSLASSAGHVDAEVAFNVSGHALIDLRVIGTNLYARLDLTGLAALPGVNVSAAQLAAAQLLLGGRWFEVSESLLNSYLPTTTVAPAQSAREQAAAKEVVDALSQLVESTPYTTLAGGGLAQTGQLSAVVTALAPVLRQFAPQVTVPASVKGTYRIAFTMAGSSATGASLKITAPNGTSGNASLALHVSLTHDATPVVAPTGATVITPALIAQIMGQVQGGALG